MHSYKPVVCFANGPGVRSAAVGNESTLSGQLDYRNQQSSAINYINAITLSSALSHKKNALVSVLTCQRFSCEKFQNNYTKHGLLL